MSVAKGDYNNKGFHVLGTSSDFTRALDIHDSAEANDLADFIDSIGTDWILLDFRNSNDDENFEIDNQLYSVKVEGTWARAVVGDIDSIAWFPNSPFGAMASIGYGSLDSGFLDYMKDKDESGDPVGVLFMDVWESHPDSDAWGFLFVALGHNRIKWIY